jgi:hypothetical protein
MHRKNWKKSELQEKLESEGWEFLTNEFGHVFDDEGYIYDGGLPSDDSLIRDYMGRGFVKIRIEDAYDSKCNLLKNGRAVYVKREVEGGNE